MVLEYLTIANLFLNSFFAEHIVFISHMLAAVFLVLTEMTVNMRIITPMLDGIENLFFGRIPLLPNLITAAFFIIWATVSLFVFQTVIQWMLTKYMDQLSVILIVVFFIVAVAINIKYRD